MNSNDKKIRELLYFFNVIYSLPKPPKSLPQKLEGNFEKIPIILSSDNNYAKFLAITGVSILYNTESFISFHVLSDGITEENKILITDAFNKVSPNFSLEFIEIHSNDYFSGIRLSEDYHVSISTCNRLLFPKLLPNIERAIYLDVDLIVMGDIKRLWEEDLDGHVFGAVPLYIDRFSVTIYLRSCSHIPSDSPHNEYKYFNSGVMLIDYKKWRECKGSNEAICEELMNILYELKPKVTPDENVLNKFAFENGGYKILQHKYNCHPYYSYKYLKGQDFLSVQEEKTLKDFERNITYFNYESDLEPGENIFIRHFFGSDKPWNSISGTYFPIPITPNLSDFWFYAKLTPYFDEIKRNFLSRQICPQGSNKLLGPLIKETLKSLVLIPQYEKELSRLRVRLWFSFGERHKFLKNKKQEVKTALKKAQKIVKNYMSS